MADGGSGGRESWIVLQDKWRILRKLGSGSFSLVYLGEDIESGEQVAVKLEDSSSKSHMLEHEYRVYMTVGESKLYPAIHWFGEDGDYRVLVMEILGSSMEQDMKKYGAFGNKKCSDVAIQCLNCLQHLHRCGYIHRDLKPQNILYGRAGQVFLIDLGLAKRFKIDGVHIKQTPNKMIGTALYCSINAHKHLELSRRDDIESLGYILLHLAVGRLAWTGIGKPGDSKEAKYNRICRYKERMKMEEIVAPVEDERLRMAISDMIGYARKLDFYAKPDYDYLRKLFCRGSV